MVLTGTARDQAKCQRLTAAKIVDLATTSIDAACRDAELVVVASPVDQITSLVIAAAKASPEDCLITDVGSTKQQIVADLATDSLAAGKFVGAHPIAGSEKTGFEHAQADLFDGKTVVITPSEANSEEQIKRVSGFWELVGGRVCIMTAADHDTHLAAVSHLPHLVSALIARMVTEQSRSLTGSGWEDITRVAAGDPTMWTAICQQNRAAILAELDRFDSELSQLRHTLCGPETGIHDWLAEAKRIKESNASLS
jgi:prephenate dehydrogenase